MRNVALTLGILGLAMTSAGQGFVDVTADQNIQVSITGISTFGNGVSFYDFNQDGLDDLTFCIPGDSIIFYINTGSGFVREEVILNTTDAKHPTWADYDNDGDPDLLVTKRSGGTRLYRNDGNLEFTNVTSSLNLPGFSTLHIYGAAWGDYDRDGWLDVYLSTYNTTTEMSNLLCRNNGNGTFTQVGFLAGVSNETGLTFQSVWQDFNQDGWPDLYVINEENVPNVMYYNNGDGTFSNVSVSSGAGIQIKSMTNSVCDYDRDGDWDIYVTNSMLGNYLLQNNDGIFTNVAADAGVVVGSFCWAGAWIDHDHDTYEDLHICTATTILNQDWFFTNNGDGTFTDAAYPVFKDDYTYTYSTAKGDFNNDGFWDMAVTRMEGDPYTLLQGIPNENHWLKLKLQGTWSNRDAVGTQIDYYIGGNLFMEYTRSGENYLGQNSQYPILSLGQATSVDSIVVTWPRGLVEKWYNIPADQTLALTEGENHVASIAVVNNGIICGGSTITLDAGEWSTYSWTGGGSARFKQVSAGGTYTVQVTEASGYTTTASLVVEEYDDPVLVLDSVEPLCYGDENGSLEITTLGAPIVSVDWEHTSSHSSALSALGAGTYAFTVTDSNGCSADGEVVIGEPTPLDAEVTAVPVSCNGQADGQAIVSITGGTEEYDINWMGNGPQNMQAGGYSVEVTDQNGCTVSVSYEITEPEALGIQVIVTNADDGANGSAEAVVSGGTQPYLYEWSTGGMDAEETELAQGEYTVEVTDANGCVVEGSASIIDLGVFTGEPNEFRIYPNPSSAGMIRIDTMNMRPEIISVTDASGRRMLEFNSGQTSHGWLDTSDWPAGLYHVRILSGGNWSSEHVVILAE